MVKTVLVTGSKGFVGRNLCASLAQRQDVRFLLCYDVDSAPEELERALNEAEVIFHLAGVNRPEHVDEFKTGNADFTTFLCDRLLSLRRTPLVVLSSSVQATLDNPYGHSKRLAEQAVESYAQACADLCSSSKPESGILNPQLSNDYSLPPFLASPCPCVSDSPFALIYRLPNVFGKGCRPNYNSAVATWCHNIARGLPIQVRDPEALLTLVYIDDVVHEFLTVLSEAKAEDENQRSALLASAPSRLCVYKDIAPTYTRKLGEITDLIHAFKGSRGTIQVPDQGDGFSKKLYATYLAALPEDQFAYPLKMNTDARGSFTEFLKTPERGQVSVNVSKPGIVKGNHWHHTKVEKFLVVSGKGVIRFRKVVGVTQHEDASGCGIMEYVVSGEKLEVVDIPPGYTHNIENVGDTDMVTVMWASEPFDPARPDTYFEKV